MRLTRQLFLALSCVIAITICLALFLTAEQWTMAGELQYTEAKMLKLQPILDSITKIQSDTASLKPKVDTLKSAKDGTTRWRVVLQSIADSVPNDTYLTAINASGTPEDTTVSLAGVSDSQSSVGGMMTQLGNHPIFDRIDLRFTQAAVSLTPGVSADSGGVQPVQFEVATHLKGEPTPPPPPAKKDKE